jgi:hypothetical protein
MDAWFDERFGLAGGSDAHFFRRAHLAKYRIVWADDAVVKEWFPPSRLTATSILTRAYSVGNGMSMLDIEFGRPIWARLIVFGQAVLSAAKGVILLPLCAFVGKRGLVRALWHVWRAGGMLTGLAGWRFALYRKAQSATEHVAC